MTTCKLLFCLVLMAVISTAMTVVSLGLPPELPPECECCPSACGNGLLTGCNVLFGTTVVCLYGPVGQACAICGAD